METSVVVLLTLNFVLIWLLPVIFFRSDGKRNLVWALTSLPFAVSPFITVASYLGYLPAIIEIASPHHMAITIAATVMSLISIFIIALTMGTHRIPVALWHQKHEDDEPACIVTWGAYKYIRHPFYTSFLIALIANIVITIHWLPVLVLVATFVQLNVTADREEKRLSEEKDGMGEEYVRYMVCTGRFLPKLTSAKPAVSV